MSLLGRPLHQGEVLDRAVLKMDEAVEREWLSKILPSGNATSNELFGCFSKYEAGKKKLKP